MKLQIKNRNLIFATLFAITAIFVLGGYFGCRKTQKVADAKETALNREITSYQYKQVELSNYIKDLEQLVRTQTILIKKSDEACQQLRLENVKQKEKVKLLEKELKSITALRDSLGVELLYMTPGLDTIPSYPL